MTSNPSHNATGQEVLVLDSDPKVLRGLERLLGEVGLIVTGVSEPVRARDQIVNKFFAVALCDLDTPSAGKGLEFLRFAREKSPTTSVIAMARRDAFEDAVQAFRAGAADVVLKQPDVVGYLKERVLTAAREVRTGADRATLLEEVAEIHEEFLKRMLDLSRQVVDLEDRLHGRDERELSGADELFAMVVDDDPTLFSYLTQTLGADPSWRLRPALTGGEAMDVATQERIQVAVVKETLPDLPGSMVVKTIKASNPEMITLLYTPPIPGGSAGGVKMVDASRTFELIPNFTDPAQLAVSLKEIPEAIRKKNRERRYLQTFRQQHYEFLKRYNDMKRRMSRVLQRPEEGRFFESSSSFRRFG